ncbi:DoxX family protein [Cellulophaga baltica]|jgi:putative oxidoreductase|uniref:DoxX family protein n=1 Tax=Cellulophaga TaxID=104264 RepID=UPI00051D0F59|nr:MULTISPECIES: DoxX family protein [Cellulophaga]KGK28891.1 DoxX family protein [Cellulophaga sp. E6(2014)]MCR1024353.1 DoxX family protein [Cellulophaga baltica]
MQKKLFNEIGLALLRIVPSVMMITIHGIPKFQNLIAGKMKFSDPIGIGEAPSLFLAVIGELVCPILIILGFKTRWAALPAAITMGVAAFIKHGSDPLATKELALLYLTFFLVIMFVGPGKYSFDRK